MAYTLSFCTNWNYTHSCTDTHMHAHTSIHIKIAYSVYICSVMACRALGKPLQGPVAVSGCLKEPTYATLLLLLPLHCYYCAIIAT